MIENDAKQGRESGGTDSFVVYYRHIMGEKLVESEDNDNMAFYNERKDPDELVVKIGYLYWNERETWTRRRYADE